MVFSVLEDSDEVVVSEECRDIDEDAAECYVGDGPPMRNILRAVRRSIPLVRAYYRCYQLVQRGIFHLIQLLIFHRSSLDAKNSKYADSMSRETKKTKQELDSKE